MTEFLASIFAALIAIIAAHLLISARERLRFRALKIEEIGRHLIEANNEMLRFYGEMKQHTKGEKKITDMNSIAFDANICKPRDNALLISELFLPKSSDHLREWAKSLQKLQKAIVEFTRTEKIPENATSLIDQNLEKYHSAYKEIRRAANSVGEGWLNSIANYFCCDHRNHEK